MSWTKEELELYDYAKIRERDEYEEREKAIQNALEKKDIETIKNAIELGLPNGSISKLTKLPIEKVNELVNILKNK